MQRQYMMHCSAAVCLFVGAVSVLAQPVTGLQFSRDTIYSVGDMYGRDSVWLRNLTNDTLTVDSIVPSADSFATMAANQLNFDLYLPPAMAYAGAYWMWLSAGSPYFPRNSLRIAAQDSVLLARVRFFVPYLGKAFGPEAACVLDTVAVCLAYHAALHCDTVVLVSVADDMTAVGPPLRAPTFAEYHGWASAAHVYSLRGEHIRRADPSEPVARRVLVERRASRDGVSTRCLVQVGR